MRHVDALRANVELRRDVRGRGVRNREDRVRRLECATSIGDPASQSRDGEPTRCHSAFRRETGTRRSTIWKFGGRGSGRGLSLKELENST
jgi:hypothetical protein